MKAHGHTRPTWLAFALASILAMLLAFASSPGASAQGGKGKASPNKPEQANCAQGRTLPVNKISVQLWTFSRYIGGTSYVGAPADAPTTGSTTAERLEYVLAFLSDLGIRNIEPYSFHGLTAEEFDALADEYGLKVRSRHMSTNVATWDANLADAKLLGQRWVGSGGFASPGISSYENVLATAETLNALGQASVENGTGKIFGHNHTAEFATKYVDVQGDGTLKSAWQILVENTDPRYVTFQLDVGWATVAGEDAVALVEEFGDRIQLLHIKDAIVTVPGDRPPAGPAVWEQTIIGQGDVDWASLFAAAQGKVKLYVLEQDPGPAAGPFVFTAESFEYIDCLVF
jgi:sugar phosphate isomerase/epimerase